MYDVAFNQFLLGKGAAAAIVLFILSAIIIGPYLIYSIGRVERIRQ
jgi:hypothetical protein